MIRFRVTEGPNAHYQIAFCAFHTFLVEIQTNPDYIQVTHAQQQPGNEDCGLLLSPAINESNKLTASVVSLGRLLEAWLALTVG